MCGQRPTLKHRVNVMKCGNERQQRLAPVVFSACCQLLTPKMEARSLLIRKQDLVS